MIERDTRSGYTASQVGSLSDENRLGCCHRAFYGAFNCHTPCRDFAADVAQSPDGHVIPMIDTAFDDSVDDEIFLGGELSVEPNGSPDDGNGCLASRLSDNVLGNHAVSRRIES